VPGVSKPRPPDGTLTPIPAQGPSPFGPPQNQIAPKTTITNPITEPKKLCPEGQHYDTNTRQCIANPP
jgi:hypothetical protein